MKLLVISDTHGRSDRLLRTVLAHPNEEILFLGDGLRDLDLLPVSAQNRLCAVSGNCDWLDVGDTPTERLIGFGAYTVFMAHGHRYDVKSGTDRLLSYAAQRGADIVLYGHTHVPEERYLPLGTVVGEYTLEKPMYVLNPGSLGIPNGRKPSYGLVDITPQGVMLSHGTTV